MWNTGLTVRAIHMPPIWSIVWFILYQTGDFERLIFLFLESRFHRFPAHKISLGTPEVPEFFPFSPSSITRIQDKSSSGFCTVCELFMELRLCSAEAHIAPTSFCRETRSGKIQA